MRAALPQTWFVPCGIAFSFLSGEVRRAPVLLQRLGLEWLHRMVQEPKRLRKRYLVQGVPFLFELLGSAVAVRVTNWGGRRLVNTEAAALEAAAPASLS